MPDVDSIYKIPILLNLQKVDDLVTNKLKLTCKKPELEDWRRVTEAHVNPTNEITIAMVGKYIDLKDAYKSLNEALVHGGIQHKLKININYVDSEIIEPKNVGKVLQGVDAILVPGGFGNRGIEGMITTAEFARERKIPYLGICLGMQVAVIEYARNVLKLSGAHSSEFDNKTSHPVIGLISEWMDSKGEIEKRDENSDLGGTMRLGSQECLLSGNSLTSSLYGKNVIQERHRHRYEVNNNYLDQMESAGLNIVGKSRDKNLVEVVEINEHPWFIGCQFHPEFTSNPIDGHPLFKGFIDAANKQKQSRLGG